jgi:hypothetical protein
MARAGARLTPSVNALLRHLSGWDELNEILPEAQTKKGRRLRWVTASVLASGSARHPHGGLMTTRMTTARTRSESTDAVCRKMAG